MKITDIIRSAVPMHCGKCGASIRFGGSEFVGVHPNGTTAHISIESPIALCPSCIRAKIKTYYSRAMLDVLYCECCGKLARVASSIPPDIFNINEDEATITYNKLVAQNKLVDLRMIFDYNFKRQSNYVYTARYFCCKCIDEMLKSGYATSTIVDSVFGIKVLINEQGKIAGRYNESFTKTKTDGGV